MADENRIKCRWCEFTTPRWLTGKDGKPKSGWPSLHDHIFLTHETEYDRLQEDLRLFEEAGELERWQK